MFFFAVLIQWPGHCALFLSHHWLALQGYRRSTERYLPSACWWELWPQLLFHHLPWKPYGFSGLGDIQFRGSKDVGDGTQVPDGRHQWRGLVGQKTTNPWPISFRWAEVGGWVEEWKIFVADWYKEAVFHLLKFWIYDQMVMSSNPSVTLTFSYLTVCLGCILVHSKLTLAA